MGSAYLSFEAKHGLRSIWQYSVENFGIQQAETYYLELMAAFDALANDNKWSISVERPNGLYRQTFIKSHRVVFSREEEDVVVVMRILGQQMDIDRQL